MGLETEQRVGSESCKRKKNSLKKTLINAEEEKNAAEDCMVFVCLLLSSLEEQRAPRADQIIFGEFLR